MSEHGRGSRFQFHAAPFHGGWGYMEECPISRPWRDVHFLTLGGGRAEVMHEIAAKLNGL